MSNRCIQGNTTISILENDPCNGNTVSASCTIDSSIYSELSLSANSTQKQINQALYLASINLKSTTDDLGERLENIAVNNTTTALSLATLTSTYPTAQIGFKVQALSITAGAKIYEKTTIGWCEYSVTITT